MQASGKMRNQQPSKREYLAPMGYDGLNSFAFLTGTTTKHTVIDQMHAFYLRILFRHVRDIWGMDVTFSRWQWHLGPAYKKEPDVQSIAVATDIYQNGGRIGLEKLSSDSLKYLCHKAGLQYSGRRNKLIDSLMQHVGIIAAPFTLYHTESLTI